MPTKVCLVKAMVFPVVMYGCESWIIKKAECFFQKNWCFWTVVLEKTLESPLNCKEIKPVNPKGNQPWIFIGSTDAEAEVSVLGHLMQRADSLEKTLMLGKIEGIRRKVVTTDETVGWHHWLNGHKFEQMLADSDGQGSLVCCSLLQRVGHELSDWTTNLYNWMQLILCVLICFSCVLLFATLWTVAC